MLDHVAFIENRNAVFIWSVEMGFIFVAQINVIYMRLLYEAMCDCIIEISGSYLEIYVFQLGISVF